MVAQKESFTRFTFQEGRTSSALAELIPTGDFSMNRKSARGIGREALAKNDKELRELVGLSPQRAIEIYKEAE